nr:hypothetical protein [Tanacetum cinerariifolium]
QSATSAVTTAMTAILKKFQATPPLASVKAVEKICVTCGGAHPYYQCLAAGGNTFPELRDNIQGYVSAAAVITIRGELKSITTRSGIVLDGPTVPPTITNPEVDERVEEILTDPDLFEYTIKFPPPPNSYFTEMFTDEHAPDYSSPLIFDKYDDDFLEVESDTEIFYDDPFDSKGEKIKESKLLIDKLDLPCDFIPSEYDSFIYQDFSRDDALPSTNNEDKVFNPCILIQEKPFQIITHVVQDKKLGISNASLMLEDFDPPFYEPLFFKEVPRSKMLLPFASENEEKVFKAWIHTSKKVHSSFIPELSHKRYKVFKINQVFKSSMKIFLFSYEKDTHILAVPCLHFYPY